MTQPNSQQINIRRQAASDIWRLSNEIVVIGSGNPVSIPGGADQCFDFQAHPDFRWLSGADTKGSFIVFDAQEGWLEFFRRPTKLDLIWESAEKVDRGRDATELAAWLEARAGRPLAFLGAGGCPAGSPDADLAKSLGEKLFHARRVKDEFEISMIRKAIAATKAAFDKIPAMLKEGVSEREVEIAIEYEMFLRGADKTAYGTIVGFADHSRVFHFSPGARQLKKSDIVLVDAGAECEGYAADVTRVFSATGKFSDMQQQMYDVLLAAQITTIAFCEPGTQWRSVHEFAARELATGLSQLGILRISADEALESEAIAMFLPHGIGHMVGLGVRDAGGRLPGAPAAGKCCGINLRVDLPLAPGYVMTVEPGIYFVPELFNDPENREKHKARIDWQRVEAFAPIGGMRIEDNILILGKGNEVLTRDISK